MIKPPLLRLTLLLRLRLSVLPHSLRGRLMITCSQRPPSSDSTDCMRQLLQAASCTKRARGGSYSLMITGRPAHPRRARRSLSSWDACTCALSHRRAA